MSSIYKKVLLAIIGLLKLKEIVTQELSGAKWIDLQVNKTIRLFLSLCNFVKILN